MLNRDPLVGRLKELLTLCQNIWCFKTVLKDSFQHGNESTKKIEVPLTDLHSETWLHTSFCCVFLYPASAKTLEFPVSIQAAVQEVLEKIDQLQSSSSKATWGDLQVQEFPTIRRKDDAKSLEKILNVEKVGNILISDVFFCFLFAHLVELMLQTTELIATIKWRICVDFGNT